MPTQHPLDTKSRWGDHRVPMITTGKGPASRIEINAGTGEVARSSGGFVEYHLCNVYGKLGVSLRREQLRLGGSPRPPMA